MNTNISDFIENFSKGKNVIDAFTVVPGEIPLYEYPPQYRYALLNHYLPYASDKEMMDSERGINGAVILGGAVVWNKEEYNPWVIDESTLVLGKLSVEGTLYIQSNAPLFVAKDIEVESLIVLEGELHCTGNIFAKNQILVSESSCIFSQGIKCREIGLFGMTQCEQIKAARRILNKKKAFRNHKKQ